MPQCLFTIEAPEIVGPDGRPIVDEPTDQPTGAILQGIAASGGQARDTARIIHDPREATRLETGDILVTRATAEIVMEGSEDQDRVLKRQLYEQGGVPEY